MSEVAVARPSSTVVLARKAAGALLALVPPEKDVDGLTERSMGRLVRGVAGLIVPETGIVERHQFE